MRVGARAGGGVRVGGLARVGGGVRVGGRACGWARGREGGVGGWGPPARVGGLTHSPAVNQSGRQADS